MARLLLAVCFVFLVITGELVEVRGRGGRGGGGRGGGSRGGGRRGGGRSGSRTVTRNGRTYGGTVTKTTPMPVTSPRSPVIVRQTTVATRPKLVRNAFVGYMVYRYTLKSGPLYRESYFQHKTEIKIPDERAVRVNFTKEIMLDPKGKACLNSGERFHLDERVESVVTEIRYDKLNGGKTKVILGQNKTVTLDKNALDQTVEISTLVKYNGSIVENSNCTQLQRVMNGTVVRMYATNPDVEEVDLKLILLLVSGGVLLIIVILGCVLIYRKRIKRSPRSYKFDAHAQVSQTLPHAQYVKQ